jgi:hypothetical protein
MRRILVTGANKGIAFAIAKGILTPVVLELGTRRFNFVCQLPAALLGCANYRIALTRPNSPR